MFKVDHFLIVPLLIHFSDYSGVSKAYEAMKNVASLINERKRRLESVDTIAHWQVAILHWEVILIRIFQCLLRLLLIITNSHMSSVLNVCKHVAAGL